MRTAWRRRRRPLRADDVAQTRTWPPPPAGARRAPTVRSSPVSPTSPKHARGEPCRGTPLRGAGHRQRDRQIGARLVDPDAAGDVDEHVGRPDPDARRGARARRGRARAGCGRSRCTTRRGGTSSLGDTSACTSTSSGRVPSIEASTTEPGLAGRLADEPRARVEHLDQPARAHLEHPGLARGAEPVLQRADGPVRALALALELQHAVDEVLEHPRAGERALLRDVADEQHGRARRLRDAHDPRGDLADLPDRAGRAGQLRRVQGLHGVDDADVGSLGLHGRQHGGEIGLGEDGHLQRGLAQTLGAQADLRRGLLAGDVERGAPAAGEMAQRHPGERRLADAGGAAEQDERAGDEAAAEHAVELPDAGGQARQALGAHVGQPHRPPGGGAGRPHGLPGRCGTRLLHQRVPRPAARALAVPAGLGVAAVGADVLGVRLRHR